MRKVLFVVYYFPPSGGPGVQRCLKFLRYLPRYGWQPVVLTVQESADFQVRDETMLAEVPGDLLIKRSFCPEPYGLYRSLTGQRSDRSLDITTQAGSKESLSSRVMRFVRGAFFIPDARMGWIPFGSRAGSRLLREQNCDVIFSSGPPFSCHMIGRSIKRQSGRPWVADFRDPWTQATFYPKRPDWAKKIDLKLERSTLHEADSTIIVGPAMASELRERYPEVAAERIKIITNGFDPADFASVPYQRPAKFRITYTGSLFFNRTPMAFFDAIEQLVKENDEFAGDIELCFAGRLDDGVLAKLNEPALKPITQLPGYLPHSESIKLLRGSSLLLLLVGTDTQSHSMVTGKVYEYLAAGVPILALGPSGGDAARLLRETESGWIFEHADREGLRSHLLELWRRYRASKSSEIDSLGLSPNEVEIKGYSRQEHTRQLAELFDSLTT